MFGRCQLASKQGRLEYDRVANLKGDAGIGTDDFELEPSTGRRPVADLRRRLDPLPAVRLVSIDDVRLPTPPDAVARLSMFYVELLGFWSESAVVFRAENFRLRFEIRLQTPVERDTVRPLGIQVPLLADVERMLVDREIPYLRETGITPGRHMILLQDPAGNWLDVFDSRNLT